MTEIILFLFLILFLGVYTYAYIQNQRKDKYEIIDIAHDVCKIGCIDRGYPNEYCFNNDSPFMDRCTKDMINTIGPLPKTGVHLEDVYAEAHPS